MVVMKDTGLWLPKDNAVTRTTADAFVDAALASAGVPIVRVNAAASYDPARLRDRAE